MAVWLTAWLAGQLGWKGQGRPVLATAPEGSSFRAAFLGPLGTLGVEIVTRAAPPALTTAPCLTGVTLTARGPEGVETFRLARPAADSPDVMIQARAPDYCRLPSMVQAPELDAARRVAAALESSRFDRLFQTARPIALWLLEHAHSGGRGHP
jgi:hypothetical protein